MDPRPVRRLVCTSTTCVILLLAAAPARAERIVDLVPDGRFERPAISPGEVKMPAGPYHVYHTGLARLSRDAGEARSGRQGLHFEWRQHPKGAYSAFARTDIPVVAGTPYTLRFWARGTGNVSAWISQ